MKKILLFLVLVSFLITISFAFIRSPSITGNVYYSNSSTPFRINTLYPFDDVKMTINNKFFFRTDENLYCKLYTNYTGSWEAATTKILSIKNTDTAVFYNMDEPGKYEWNIFCEDFEGNDDTWAHKLRQTLIIKEPLINVTINETSNTTENNSDEQENIDNEDNDDTDSSNNSQTPEENQDSNSSSDEDQEPTCSGCMHKNACYKINVKITIDGDNLFCNSNGVFEQPRINGKECSQNFQCASDYCLNNKCQSNNFLTKLLAVFGFV